MQSVIKGKSALIIKNYYSLFPPGKLKKLLKLSFLIIQCNSHLAVKLICKNFDWASVADKFEKMDLPLGEVLDFVAFSRLKKRLPG